jgi:hypothetical protein
VLFVPILMTMTFGLMPSSSPCSMRHKTFSVRSHPKPSLVSPK